jgi:NAD(P)-dependent dehydrogenase (short-subunit alcohol dehydrogenase family)
MLTAHTRAGGAVRIQAGTAASLYGVEDATAIVPIGRPGVAAEVAAVVAFLAGDDGRFVTGQTILLTAQQHD